MSEVLLDFAEPLLEGADDNWFNVAISIAAVCWNGAFLPPKEWEAELNKIIVDRAKGDAFKGPETRELIQVLIDRKKALFGHDNRLILNYQIVEEEAGPRLLVASAPFERES